MSQERPPNSDRWRALADLTGQVDPRGTAEFAPGVDEAPNVSRRDLGKLLGASLMLAGAGACTRAPRGRIVAYGRQPEDTPGIAKTYATTMTLGGYGTGLLVEEHEGRPTKIEGNPEHPASLGASGTFEQASLLSLYDPDRLRGVREKSASRSFDEFTRAFGQGTGKSVSKLHVLMESTTSSVVQGMLAALSARGAVVHFHDPLSRENIWSGTQLALGEAVDPIYDLEKADVIIALDADLLASGPFHLRHARGFAARRRVPAQGGIMNRLYVVEPALSVTGSVADHRLRSRRRDVVYVAAAILRVVLLHVPPSPWTERVASFLSRSVAPPEVERWALAAAGDLVARPGRVAVVAGESQPAIVHALAQLTNLALGAGGGAVRYVTPAIAGAGPSGLSDLLSEIDRGNVDHLAILGGNPSYSAPVDLEWSRRVRNARQRTYLTAYENETSRDATWVIPEAHFLESWGDARALDGTASFTQPMIEPLYGGKTAAELLAVLLGDPERGSHELLMRHWRSQRTRFDDEWSEALQRGVLTGTAAPDATLDPRRIGAGWDGTLPEADPRLEILFQPDAHARDGAFANNGWLLELPDPITKVTWGNAACMSAVTAARLGLRSEDIADLRIGGRSVRAPVLVVPGAAEESVAVSLGLGRDGSESLARGVGFNAYRVRSSTALWADAGLEVVPAGERASLAVTQEHASMEGRPIALSATLAELQREPRRFAAANAKSPTLYQLPATAPHQWAMAIDLNVCTGCSACVVACQAENNVPIVGKEGVEKGRVMHWLRIDRYFEESSDGVTTHHQPMACQHCEKAPCEYVCPVGATQHSTDGLNEMVYNRCVGTRFCSNNCPYKVRRFNWFDYNRDKPETLRMAMNPDVTVRSRGVMEKCTYCVQRIRETEIRSHTTGLPIRDGDVRTACEQACPTQAITFGSITDPSSRVAVLRKDSRAYAVLHEVGTEPRTRYLARITNPNPELAT